MIGIDSDGTVFDSMEIKHKRVFQPLACDIWALGEIATDYYHIAESINLYSTDRGVNRFQGLAMAFDRLAEQSKVASRILEGHTDLSEFVLSGAPLSADSLAAYNSDKHSDFLDKVQQWSQRSDALYEEIMEQEGTPTYPRVKTILERASKYAELMVISSSSGESLKQDWGTAGLTAVISKVYGQEEGNKSIQLRSALATQSPSKGALMIGDAPGDLEAARDNEILFYPIIPGLETESWERFETESLERFLSGNYDRQYEQELLTKFKNALSPAEVWPLTKQVTP
ncbi:MAG TPA: hypothetical protein DCX06_07280 [Opitutae bacterium]|nr:hypothetical protein [Opitutae bacterium]